MRDAQRKLYQWRKEFFHDKFKSKYFNPDLPVSNWITLGLDDDHAYNVVPYQITRNFNEVMKLAASKKVLDPNQYEHFYFASDEMASFLASRKFEGDFDEDAEEDLEEVNCGCENDTEEEKWKKEVAGMAMLWHFIAMNCGVSKVSNEKVFLKQHFLVFLVRQMSLMPIHFISDSVENAVNSPTSLKTTNKLPLTRTRATCENLCLKDDLTRRAKEERHLPIS